MSRIKYVIEQIHYDFTAFEIMDFIAYVERIVRRPIRLMADDFDYELSAIWLKTKQAHYIIYNQRLHPVHQQHNILHELGHILLRHQPQPLDHVFTKEQLIRYGIIKPEGRLRRLDAIRDPTWEEVEAEDFVYRLQQKIVTAGRLIALMGQSTSIDRLRQHVDGMGFEV